VPSRSAAEYNLARLRALQLVRASVSPPPQSVRATHKAACLHAALAMFVAAWEAYLERLVRETQALIADPLNPRLSATLALLTKLSEAELKKFNTPNSDNSRNLLIEFTGYDPINDWVLPGMGLSGIQTRARVDEILKLRHSFAHGFAIPTNIQWVKSRNSPGVLSVGSLQLVDGVLTKTMQITDKGMANHLLSVFGIEVSW
jgi:hypothetical protein